MEILYTLLFMLGCMIVGYLCGSIPNGVLIGKMHGINIRDYGSHNTGGTNVGRTLGKKAGIMTMILDGLKCFAPMLVVLLILVYTPIKQNFFQYKYLNELMVNIVAFFVFLGHTFPLFNHFQGGKCVASFGGYVVFVSPILFVFGAGLFFTLFKISKRISVCSIISVPSVLLASFIPMILDLTILPDITSFNGGMYYHPDFMLHISYLTVITIFLSAALIIIRHKSNINRIKKGAEPETHFQNTIDVEKKEA